MQFFRPLLALLLLCTAAHCALAGGTDTSRILLTPALLEKTQRVHNDMEAAASESTQERHDGNVDTVEKLARLLDSDPGTRLILATHKLSSKEYAGAFFALLHASAFVELESMDNAKAQASAYSKLTAEQRANIELVRKGKRP